jgi:hypothetical protein
MDRRDFLLTSLAGAFAASRAAEAQAGKAARGRVLRYLRYSRALDGSDAHRSRV